MRYSLLNGSGVNREVHAPFCERPKGKIFRSTHLVIDEEIVITGSFNFTRSADSRNAENVIIISDKSVANEYLQNWLKRKSKNESSR